MAIRAKILNQHLIEKALLDAFEIWASEDINGAHWSDQFQDMAKWRYDNITERKNNETVGSPRDIYDLGRLYESGIRSYKFARNVNGAEVDWHWDATNSSGEEYGWYVHEGVGTNVTARPFTDDIAVPSSFFRKAPGKAFILRTQQALYKV